MKHHNLFYFRLILLILAVIASIWHLVSSVHAIQYFTEQSNLFIELWLLTALLLQYREKSLQPIEGRLRGAIILYLCVTCLVNAALLGGGEFTYTNIIQHYVVPIMAIFDWLVTERNIQYQWSYLWIWLIYPLAYCFISIIIGSITSFYPYFFVNYPRIGIVMMIVWILILVVIFIAVGALLILVNRKRFEIRKSD